FRWTRVHSDSWTPGPHPATGSVRREGCVKADGDVVRVEKLRAALAPHRVPWRLFSAEACADDSGIEVIDFGRSWALDSQPELVTGCAMPVGEKAAHLVLGIEHEPNTIRKKRVDVPL